MGIIESAPNEPYDSKIDPYTGNSHRYTVTNTPLVVDVGYTRATSDLSALQIIIDGHPSPTFAVGDTFTVYGAVTPNGTVPEHLGATLTRSIAAV